MTVTFPEPGIDIDREAYPTGKSTLGVGNTSSIEDREIPQTLWALVQQFAWRHRALLIFAVFLNAVPGFAIAFQTFGPKYLIDDIVEPTDISVHERLSPLAVLMAIYLGAAFSSSHGGVVRELQNFYKRSRTRHYRIAPAFLWHINGLCLPRRL